MLEALISLTETVQFEDSGGLCVCSFNSTAGAMDLELAIDVGDESEKQHWRVHCDGVQQFRMQNGWVDTITVAAEHPLLWQFTEPVVGLYFSAPAPTPLAIVGALYERHRRLVGNWIPFHFYLNPFPGGMSALLQKSAGELASGPAAIIDAYAEVLAHHGIRSSRLPRRPAKIWNGQEWVVPPALRALLLDESFIIAENFSAAEIKV